MSTCLVPHTQPSETLGVKHRRFIISVIFANKLRFTTKENNKKGTPMQVQVHFSHQNSKLSADSFL